MSELYEYSSGTTIAFNLGNYTNLDGSLIWGTTPTFEEQPVANFKGKSHLVISRQGKWTETHETQDEALAAAKRLASKETEEFYVFSPFKVVRPVPTEVEVTDA